MSDKEKNEVGAPISPKSNVASSDRAASITQRQERDYEKLVEKSLEEQVSDTSISRADLTNPNLHYGTSKEVDTIDPASLLDEENSSLKNSTDLPKTDKITNATEEESRQSPEGQTVKSSGSNFVAQNSQLSSSAPVTETNIPEGTTTPPVETPIVDTDPQDENPTNPTSSGPDKEEEEETTTETETETYNPDLVSAQNSVEENSASGTTVATLDLEGGAGTAYSYAITDENGHPLANPNFIISGSEIVVAPGANIDFESNPNFSIYVTGTDAEGNSVTEQLNINITDQDEFDVSAISDTDSSTNTVAENGAVGTSVGITAFASDADGTNNTITYSLSNDAGGLFSIDANTGEVTVAGNIDFESGASQTIEVTATSSDGSTSTQSYNIGVTDQDEFDVSAISDTDASTNTIAENASVGTSVGITAFASDADGSNNTVTYSLSNDAGGLFSIDANTGEVTVAGNIDFESGASQTIEVTATSSDGSTSTQSYNIGVTDQDEFDVSAISDTNGSTNTVAENSAVGTSVGITAFASDADGSNNTVTYSLSNDAGGLFSIDANTGEVTVAGNIDFESGASQTIEVTATSADGSTSTQSYNIGVTDQDEFDISAISDTDSGTNTVAENASIGTSVGITAFASDADSSNNTVTYSLSNDAGGLFSIDANTGEVTVAGSLDFESSASQTIEVTATSADGSTSTQSYNIGVTDQDEFDVSAISDTDSGTNTVAENVAIGTSVGITAFASDADGSNNTVTYSLSNDAGGLFSIDANTGEVTVAGNIDFESGASQTIEVTATSADGSASTQSYSIAVEDINEAGVSAISDTDGSTNSVAENASVGTSVGITAFASDTDTADTISYSLSNDAGGLFSIDANTGEVTVAGNIDFETGASQTIEVTATSSDGSTSTQSYNIGVTDQDEFDVSAISDTDSGTNTVAENSAVGTSVGITAFASDADGSNNTVTYSLSNNAGGLFTIDANTGEVTVASNIDFESGTSQTIEVTATSSDGSSSTQSYNIGVTDQDEFDVSAISDTDSGTNTVAENSAVGTSVGITAFASDADGTNNTVTYSLSNDAGGLFSIDANTGEVTVAGNIDFESGASQTIEVTATSSDGSTSTQSYNIGVTDQDEFDVSAISDTDNGTNTVAENSAVGTSVGITAFASDADGSNNSVTYSLSNNAGGLFSIDANTGEVTVASNIDFESGASQTIEVTATSADGSTSTQSYNIGVTDQDEFDVSAISDTDSGTNTVAENSAVGTSVGITAFASDADGSNNSVTYSLSNNAGGLFTIDANTGEVTVASNIDFESGASQTIEVTATSSDGSTSTQSYNIGVTDQDEFDVSAISDTDSGTNTVAENSAVGTSVGITAFASDADGSNNTVTYSLSNNAGGLFTIDANTGEVTVAGNIDFEPGASQTIEVTATSADGSTSTQSYNIGVTDQDEFDVSAISDTDASANYITENSAVGTSVGITAFASDADGTNNGITYSLSNDAGGLFSIDTNTGEVTVAGTLDAESATSQTIEVTATSTDGSTSTQSYSIAILDQDEFDVSAISDSDAGTNTVAENSVIGTSVGITALATDADVSSNGITYSLSNDAGGLFSIDANTGEVTVAGSIDFESGASQTIEVTATSADGSTSTQSYNIGVTDQDEFDVSAISDTDSGTNTVAENSAVGTSVGITAFASDADGSNNNVTYSLSNDAGGLFSIDANTGEVTVAGSLDFESSTSQTIEVTATSSDGSTSTQSYNIGVTDQDEFDISAITDTDLSGGALVYTPSNSIFSYASGSNLGDGTPGGTNHRADVSSSEVSGLSITLPTGDTTLNNGDIIRFSFNDENGNTITVSNATIQQTAFATAGANETGILTAQGLDQNGNEIAILLKFNQNDGSSPTPITAGTGFYDNDINPNAFNGTDIELPLDQLTPANTVAENASIGASVGITAFASDADGSNNTVTYSLSDDAGGLFTINSSTGEVTVASALDYETDQSHSIEVTATSSDGSTSTETFAIGVNDENEGPVALNIDLGATNEDTGILITEAQLLANSSDVDAGTTLSITSLTLQDGAQGTLTDNGNGTWTFNPTADMTADDVSFNFTTSDGALTDNAVATIDVTAVADAPSLTVAADSSGGTGTESIVSSSAEIAWEGTSAQFVQTIDGWQTDHEAIEVRQTEHLDNGISQHASDGDWFIELNMDNTDKFADSGNIFQNLETHDGASYTLDFDFSARPGYDATISKIEILWDGVVIDTVSADGSSLTDTSWTTYSYTFTGDGDLTRLEFRAAGTDVNYGRGGYIDNITLTEVTSDFTATGDEDQAIDLPNITSSLSDQDGSETLATSISNIPDGAILSDGTNSFTSSTGDNSVDVSNWDMTSINITPPSEFDGQFDLTVTATSTESSNGDTNTVSETIEVTVLPDHSEDTPYQFAGSSDSETITGTTGDDILIGRGGNDDISGGAGNDLFIFQEGDGHDTIDGGAGGGWTDTIHLADASGGSDLGTYGTDWTVTLTEGTIDSVNADSIDFSDDAGGTITLQDGSSVDFTDIERLDW